MDRFGRYELLFEIGSGGMARVYLARQLGDSGFERLVAIKRVHAHLVGDPDIYSMVSDEARIAALLRHPNVVSVVDVVDRGGELLLVLDYVEGFALSKLARAWKKPVSPAIAARLVTDGLEGLHAAHEARDLLGGRLDVVHRDVSPQNLLVGVDGVTRVIDFGIARARGNATLTQTGVVKGKVAYMAPERLDEKEVDRRSDLFAMGAVLNELLVGASARPDADEARDIARAMLSSFDPSAVERVAPRLAPVLERALARKPSDRFATAEEMARAIAAAETPASSLEVASWVRSLEEAAIAERRAKITEAIEAALVDADDLEAPVTALKSATPTRPIAIDARGPTEAAAATAIVPSEERAPSRSRARVWVGVGLVGLAAANAAAWIALRPADATGGSASTPRADARATSSAAPLPGVESGTSSERPSTPTATPLAAASTSASTSGSTSSTAVALASAPSIGPAPKTLPSATSAATSTPAAAPSLHANPYASH